MSIVLNKYLEVREGKDGQPRLFGKVGFQTMGVKTDKVIIANMCSIERALDAGELTDINGNVVYDNAVIQVLCLVSRTKEGHELDQVSSIRTFSGETVSVPAVDATTVAYPAAEAPF